jgi:hypothetical protein
MRRRNNEAARPEEKRPTKRRVVVGEPFEASITVAKARARIVYAVLTTVAVFLIGAAVLGLYRGEFSGLAAVWGATAPIYGGIAGYYLSERKNGERKDE